MEYGRAACTPQSTDDRKWIWTYNIASYSQNAGSGDLAGLALVIVGILYKLNIREAGEVLPKDLGLAPILSIIIEPSSSSLRFWDAAELLKKYAIVLLTIFIIQVAIAVYVFIQVKDSNELRMNIRKSIQKNFR
ncbi:hypothetical protein NQ317_005173 [Molorchus minor]|uniref:Uncharacterized protein n=1 Tax=Molorchus minor TaxID=1323400 RepID=A0ABQ9JCN5_9CUCU|nr:hypothetical protein NQ317_005173 [Molorchus minor]